jgi:hypothetical protein
MRHLYAIAALSLILAGPLHAAELPLVPDDRLTPGVIATSDPNVVCHPNYSKTVRHTSGALKHRIYQNYRIDPHSGRFEVDHRLPLSIGGADVEKNLWAESYSTEPWNASVKDRLEVFLLHEACYRHTMTLPEAQQLLLPPNDWRDIYRRFFGEPDGGALRENGKAAGGHR